MFYRQKLILSLLQVFDGSLDKTDFQKYLFLYTKICQPKEKRDYTLFFINMGAFRFSHCR
jgi:hypothetical protein